MKTIFSKINRHFAFTRKDRNGIYILLFLITATIAFRAVYPFWKISQTVISAQDISAAAFISGDVGETRYSGRNIYSKSNSHKSYDTSGDNDSNNDNNNYNNTRYSSNSRSTYTLPSYMQKKVYVVALNSADTLDLKELRGIGSAYARRIIAYREKLGGFVRKEQLREVWGIDTALYARIVPQITIDASQIRKININTTNIDQLKRHPYLDYYLAKEIVKHREKYGNFSTTEDLLKVNLIDDNTFNLIKPYLTIYD